MTQEEVNVIVTQSYSDKIQMSTLNPSTVDYLLYKTIEGGLKQFKGYSAKIDSDSSLTETEFRTITDTVVTINLDWFNS
jgi:hypothetical protein